MKKWIILGIIVATSAGTLYWTWGRGTSDGFRCPNDYATAEEYAEGTAKWVSEEFKNSPNLTQDDLLSRRNAQLSERGCERSKWLDGSYLDIPSIGASADYGKDFKTYHSDLGFSFKYPPHFRVLPHDPEAPNWIVLAPVDNSNDAVSAIIVSMGENDENMTPEEWLLGPTSGYQESRNRYGNYHKTRVDGQDAVYTDGGMWFVVNTPDNKIRLSIAYTAEEGANIPFTETGIVIESLVFER